MTARRLISRRDCLFILKYALIGVYFIVIMGLLLILVFDLVHFIAIKHSSHALLPQASRCALHTHCVGLIASFYIYLGTVFSTRLDFHEKHFNYDHMGEDNDKLLNWPSHFCQDWQFGKCDSIF